MKKDILNIKSTLPTIDKSYSILNPIDATIGRYFDYKKETAMIKHATVKLKEQSKIIIKKIDAELKVSMDKNKKDFQKEMFRLKSIAKDLANSSKNQKAILNHIEVLTNMLKNPDIELSVKEQIPQLIAMAHQQLNDERDNSMQKLNMMSDFDPNQKLIKG